MITSFFDMSSGGSEKEDWTLITVNLQESEAVEWFENEFNHSPHEVTCDCCGDDYFVNQWESLENCLSVYSGYSHKHFTV